MANQNKSVNPTDGISPGNPNKDNGDQVPLELYEVLETEYVRLHRDLPADYYSVNKTPKDRLEAIYKLIHSLSLAEARTALCISGGGIRSATFALGILQGLARCGLLGNFHYLSTVSGGGYIGSWLSSWIKRADVGTVVSSLAGATVTVTNVEPDPVRHLRSYSNYLSPKLGLLSADTWTLAAIYLRNLFLNWLVLVPFLASALMVPRIYAAILKYLTEHSHESDVGLLIVGGILGVVAVVYIGFNRPSVHKDQEGWPQWAYLCVCLGPLTLAAILISLYWAAYYSRTDDDVPLRSFIVFGLAINVLGVLWTFMGANKSKRRIFGEFSAAAVTGLFSGWLLWLASTAKFFFTGPDDDVSRLTYTCLAVPILLGIFLLSAFLYNGLISFWTNDEDREWWSRSDSWILIVTVGWAAISGVVIYGPIWLNEFYVSGIGGLSGLIALVLGKSSDTPANKKTEAAKKGLIPVLKEHALMIAAPLFLVFVLILLSAGTSFLLYEALTSEFLAYNFLRIPAKSMESLSHKGVIDSSGVWIVVLAFLLLLLISVVVAFFININRYSLHAMYRNRLIRAYLGASNPNRKPNKFTGFDPKDNFPVHQLSLISDRKPKLLHVLNLTLNLVAGKQLAWQERKAESFTVSPMHSGSCNPNLGYRLSEKYGGIEKDPAESGISLGTAMAISGAAASPNMGYHSSAMVGALMTLFNARLGWWLGNPGAAGKRTYDKEGPFWALKPMLAEAFGLTDDESAYCYLSDGGHFENLGLYEMVLRRSHIIVVSDAGCDEKCSFEDLGNAIRKIRIDLGIPIDFNLPINIRPRSAMKKKKEGDHYGALACIRYTCVDGPTARDGILVYIKPSFYGNEPRDVYNYAISHPAFPHETTADQFFTESQFESYRMLGSHIMETICGPGISSITFDEFVELTARHLCPGAARTTTQSGLQEIFTKACSKQADEPSATSGPPKKGTG